LRHLKGSDASNVHDEEVAEDELEFSDDEAEAAHKRAIADRRERYRSQSVASSRHATPTPSQMRDQDMADELYGANPYDESGPVNDMDFGAGPSRPAPIPYDDPYSDAYGVQDPSATSSVTRPQNLSTPQDDGNSSDGDSTYDGRGRGRGRRSIPGRGAPGRRDDRGRGRGRDRPRGNRGRGRGRGRDDRGPWTGNERARPPNSFSDEYVAPSQRSLSPTSLAIARATGQYSDGSSVEPDIQGSSTTVPQFNGGWSYPQFQGQQQYDFSHGYQQQYVQPHINPRFASNFGMNFGFEQGNHYAPYGFGQMDHNARGNASAGWNQDWSVNNEYLPSGNGGDSPSTVDGNNNKQL